MNLIKKTILCALLASPVCALAQTAEDQLRTAIENADIELTAQVIQNANTLTKTSFEVKRTIWFVPCGTKNKFASLYKMAKLYAQDRAPHKAPQHQRVAVYQLVCKKYKQQKAVVKAQKASIKAKKAELKAQQAELEAQQTQAA